MDWLTGYDYRKSVTLSRASGAVSNYQMKLLLGESSGATGEDVDCGGHCLSTFNDLRFTKSDGTTLLDYWIESVTGTTPNQLATIWIEFDSIGTGATTFYMYYGKADAAAVSNGANTFLFFDDFERGSNGDPVGGDWDKVQGTEEISTTNDVGDLTGFTGSRSLKVFGSNTQLKLPILATLPDDGTFAIRANIYKPNPTDSIQLSCRKNNYFASAQIQIDGKMYWLNSSSTWIYSNNIANEDSWDSVLELRNVNFSAKTYEVYYNNSLVASATSMSAPAGADYYVYISGSPTNGHNSWIDNVIVRHYRATEPVWGEWGSEEALEEALVPAAQMTLTEHAPTTNIYYLPVTLMTIVGLAPVNKATSFIPVLEMTLIGLSPYFGASPFIIPADTATLTPGNPSYVWAIPLSQQSAAKIIFSCTLTGAPDGLSDLTLPMSSFQARMRDGDPSYVSVVVPSSATYAADIVARANGEIIIKKGYLMRDGSAQMEEISRVDYESIHIDRGARNDSVTLSGHKTVTSTVASERTITGVSYYGLQANGKRRVRANFNLFLRCGDVCIYSNDPGDRFTVGNISYFVGAEPVQMIMEVGEA